jgi:hypothetical protein
MYIVRVKLNKIVYTQYGAKLHYFWINISYTRSKLCYERGVPVAGGVQNRGKEHPKQSGGQLWI